MRAGEEQSERDVKLEAGHVMFTTEGESWGLGKGPHLHFILCRVIFEIYL